MEGDDEAILEVLNATQHPLGKERWQWKYRSHPNFDPSILILARNSKRLVGCLHRVRNALFLGHGSTTDAVLEGDLGVLPEFRRKGLARSMMSADGFGSATLTYGFCDQRVYDTFHSKIGETANDDLTVESETSTL